MSVGYTIRKRAKPLDNGTQDFIFTAEGGEDNNNNGDVNGPKGRHHHHIKGMTVKVKFIPTGAKGEDAQVIKATLLSADPSRYS